MIKSKPDSKRVTVRDIAREAGVSAMTVSLALRNHPDTAVATRQRIQKLAARMGYRPDPEIAKLMGILGRGRGDGAVKATIAVLNPWEDRDEIRKRVHTREMLEGAKARAEELGYRLEEHWLRAPHMTLRRLNQILDARGIAGVLIPPLPMGMETLALEWERIAAVSMTRTPLTPLLDRVCPNHFAVMRLALRKVRENGYRRPGFVQIREIEEKVGFRWKTVFNDHLFEAAEADRVPMLMMESWDEELFLQWFRAHRPDVILCDRLHPAHWLKKAGYALPEDVGFVALFYNRDHPAYTGVDVNSRQIGAHALEMLSSKLMHNRIGPPEHAQLLAVQPEWVDGGTLGRKAVPGSKASRRRGRSLL